MKFRTYQIFFLLSAVLAIVTLCSTILQIIEPSGATNELTNFCYKSANGTITNSPVALGVVLIVTTLVNLFGFVVSGFQNFELQKRVSILGILLCAGYYLLLGIYAWILAEASFIVSLQLLFPLFMLIFNALAFFASRRTEAAILARASGFRLRD